MNLELTDEQTAVRTTVRRFLSERASVAAHVRPMLGDPAGTTEEVWRGLADLGVLGLLVPSVYGGAGMTMLDAGIVAEELGAGLHPGPWLSSAVVAPRALMRMGVDGAAEELWRGIADGSAIVAVGSLDGARLTAGKGSDGVVLRGTITASDVCAADLLLVLAEKGDGTGLFALETTARGVQATLQRGVDDTRKQFTVVLDGTPATPLATASTQAVQALVDDVLIAYAADALGAAQAVMTQAVEYAKVRRQFGQPIGSFQAVQHLCVDMYETVELARSGVIHALWAADAAVPAERHLAAVRAKAFAGRLATVGDTAIQILGGVGYTWEHDAHLYLKRLLSWSTFLGRPGRYLKEMGQQLALELRTPR